MSKKIGYIGLGVLGSAMVPNLIKSGFEVIGYDVRPEVLEELGKLGMTVACSPKDTAERSDVVITCLPTIKVLLDVFGGDDGIDKADKADQIVIETSTFPVDAKEKAKAFMEAAGKRMLDCPVSGNRILAVKKQLTAFGSGDEAAYREVEDIIQGFASRTFYIGEFGSGMKMKFCANILNLVHNSVAAEVMVLGMKSGLDPEIIHSVISGSGSSSSIFETRGAMMANNNYDHEGMNFSIPIKDSRFISDHAHQMRVPTPIYHVALQSYYAAVAQGHFDEDAAAVCAAMERAANFERPKNEKKNNEF
ncbi:MAG: NAD(P)-dependent oxidoreductase [Rhodospirillales bacterium]|jgi:3-hydroxyisobutyrate dehydrogenase|nr:NAD(P)-dependent oxidoreductase [Rhodospirillales bacterium]MDP7623734.1 NAD(P)-dependent oxidoreductase [Rhodospirillales bacterium]HJO87463.1 NAD(P)-dependent oxidoreductase [Rhodospirillales bacterium]